MNDLTNSTETENHPITATGPPVLPAVLTLGALWGIAEATLGYLLHLASRLVPGVGLAGFVMYPVAVALMYAGYRVSRSAATPFLMSVIAAAIKWSSAAMPSVGVIFVANPSLAILAEGTITAGVFLAVAHTRVNLPAGIALGSIAWRALFIGFVALLPVRKGILVKGPAALASFLVLEAAVNAIVIAAGAWLISRRRSSSETSERRRSPAESAIAKFMLRPAVGAVLVLIAVATEATLATI